MKKSLLFILAMLAITLSRCLFNMDVEDEGWVLTAYQNIFSHPESVSYNFLYYNSLLVGGLWNLLFGGWGLLAFRILYVLVELLKALLVYLILRNYVHKSGILLGYAMLTLCYAYYNFTDHNQLTLLFALCAAFLLLQGLEKQKGCYIFAAGVVVALNVFTRLPNLSLCALIFVLIPFCFRLSTFAIRLLPFAFIGFFLGCGLELLLMHVLGHLPIFLENITSGLAASSDVDSTHNLFAMAQMTLLQWGEIAFHAAVFALFIRAFQIFNPQSSISNLQSSILNRKSSIIILQSSILILLLTFIAWHYQSALIPRLYAIQTLICIRLIRRDTSMRRYIAWVALIIAYTMPLGSDYGYSSAISYYAMSLSLPLSLASLLPHCKSTIINLKSSILNLKSSIFNPQSSIFNHQSSFFILQFSILILLLGICDSYRLVKQSSMCVAHLQHYNNTTLQHFTSIHSPLATTFITNDDLLRLNPLLDELAKYASAGDTILCFQSLPMVHYLTQTQPYLHNPWPWTYTASDMERHFRKAQTQAQRLPLVVREKGYALDPLNINNYPDWDNASAQETRFHQNKKIQLIQSFLQNNHYSLIWENESFQILSP